jgi:hypothetical protein
MALIFTLLELYDQREGAKARYKPTTEVLCGQIEMALRRTLLENNDLKVVTVVVNLVNYNV